MAAETSTVTGIAGRYATALFALARERGQLDPVATDLQQLQAMIDANADIARLVRSPVFGRDEQAKAMAAIIERTGLHDLVRRFVGVAARNGRLFVLEQMIRDYRALLSRQRGEVTAQVIAARPLTDQQMTALTAALKAAGGKMVLVDTQVDPGLIGGLVVKIGSRMVDASLRSKLQNLKVAMKGVA